MMFGPFRRTQQRIGRSKRIAQILIKYGFDFVVEQLGLTGPFWLKRSVRYSRKITSLTVYERFRCMLEELGPTFVKLGQALSTRTDLLPYDLIVELDKLQDKIPPFPFSIAKTMIEAELGDSLENLFFEFEEKPFAAASIGQVHRAVLPDGTQVVVKVQRPGIRDEMQGDLLLMQDLAYLAARRTEWGRIYAVQDLVEEFGQQLREQLDYAIEGRHTDRFRRAMIPQMYVPKVFWEYSTHKLLTTEYIQGIKLDNFEAIDAEGLDRKDLAATFVEIMGTQALNNGFYHADPHPGNLMVTTGATIVFMDFGMVGYLDEDLKTQLLNLILAIVQNDLDAIVYALLDIGIVKNHIDRAQLRADIQKALRKYYEIPLAELPAAETIDEMLSLATKHQVRLPADLTLLLKVALVVEGLATQLDPDLSIVDIAKPFAFQIQQERFSPQYFIKEMTREIRGIQRLMGGLPARLDRLLQSFESGEFGLKIEVIQLDRYVRQISVIANRLAAAIVVAAILLASTLALLSDKGPNLFNVPIFAIIGFVASLTLGLWLLIGILKSGAL